MAKLMAEPDGGDQKKEHVGHCHHCHSECRQADTQRRAGDWLGGDHYNPDGTEWLDGECPACAEAEKAITWLANHPFVEMFTDTDGYPSWRILNQDVYVHRLVEYLHLPEGGQR